MVSLTFFCLHVHIVPPFSCSKRHILSSYLINKLLFYFFALFSYFHENTNKNLKGGMKKKLSLSALKSVIKKRPFFHLQLSFISFFSCLISYRFFSRECSCSSLKRRKLHENWDFLVFLFCLKMWRQWELHEHKHQFLVF